MRVLVDTSVWSLALRRDSPSDDSACTFLRGLIESGEPVLTTGLILQELLQGFAGPTARDGIVTRFSSLPFVLPDFSDYVQAAELRNVCRRNGIQLGTIDALLAQLCIRHELTMLTADQDFKHAAKIVPLVVWQA